MNAVPENAPEHDNSTHTIEVADETLTFRLVSISDPTPTGAQIAAAAGFRPVQQASILQILADGELEDIRPPEVADLHRSRRFVAVESDRSYRLTLDGERFDWPCRIVSGGLIRKLGSVPKEKDIYLERADEADRRVGPHDLVDLDAPRVESFLTEARFWKLNVQGVVLDVRTPTIVVRDALTRAGFDPDKGWYIFLKVEGQPKRPVELTDEIDLRTPGIEKLRLTPREVTNGEGHSAPRRAFALLDFDENYLDELGLRWETVVDTGRQWLLIHDFPVPQGFTVERTVLALEIPTTYPGAQIDMFYMHPPLVLHSGREIDRANVAASILGTPFIGWSRHRGAGSPWNPATDNVATHIALVESAIAKEIDE
jgi:hypothetical protein